MPDLKEQIREQLRRGVPPSAIYKELKSKGLPTEALDEVLKEGYNRPDEQKRQERFRKLIAVAVGLAIALSLGRVIGELALFLATFIAIEIHRWNRRIERPFISALDIGVLLAVSNFALVLLLIIVFSAPVLAGYLPMQFSQLSLFSIGAFMGLGLAFAVFVFEYVIFSLVSAAIIELAAKIKRRFS
jgi:hypothetical protein